jgi:hypothetical protein
MFAVHGIEDVVERPRTHCADLVGVLVQYEDVYRLGYVRCPEGIVGTAEPLGQAKPASTVRCPHPDSNRGRYRTSGRAIGRAEGGTGNLSSTQVAPGQRGVPERPR